jgi:hypothetical protein
VWQRIALIAGDSLALFLFVYLGQREHETLNAARPLLGALLQTAVFVTPWLLVGGWLGAFPKENRLRTGTFLSGSLNAWLVAAPLALLLRAFLFERAVIPTLFFVVTLGLGGAGILGWRLLFALGQQWTRRRSLPAP